MSSVPQGSTPAIGTRSILVGFILAALLAFAYMATAAADNASARDIVISDSSSPLSNGTGPNFAGETVAAGSATRTQSGNCTTPNVSIKPSLAGAPTNASVLDAIQAAVQSAGATPEAIGVQTGDTVYFCSIANYGAGLNTYAPAESGIATQAIDLSDTPSITIAELPGQTAILQANGTAADDYRFFTDNNTQGRSFTIKDLTLTQGGAGDYDGGFIKLENAVNPGSLTLDNVVANGFELNTGGDGGVVQGENVTITGSGFATTVDNDADGNGGAIDADGNVTVTNSQFGEADTTDSNIAGTFGGAISAGGNVSLTGSTFEANLATADDGGAVDAVGTVTVQGSNFLANFAGQDGGAIDAQSPVTVSGTASTFFGDGTGAPEAGGNGGGINAQSVTVSNASAFGGINTTPDPDVGLGLNAGGDGGAISTFNVGEGVGTGCETNTPTTPCLPGTVNITGAASFTDNTANTAGGLGGAIYADGGATINGNNGTTFTAGSATAPSFGNEADAGGAIAVGGLFQGVNVVGPPAFTRACHPSAGSSITNLTFTRQLAAAVGGAVFVTEDASDTTDATKRCAVTLTGNTFTANVADGDDGGAVGIDGGNVTSDNSYNTNGSASIGGAALTTANGGAVAVGSGGPGNAVVSISNEDFTGNVSTGAGGALWVDEAAGLTVANSTFVTNSSAAGGAVILDDATSTATGAGAFSLTGNTYTSNVGTGTGGAIHVNDGAATIGGSTFTNNNNSTTGNGGAIQIVTGASVIAQNTFTTNKAGTTSGDGGAIRVSGGTPTITENAFTGNTATGTGGGNGGAIRTGVALSESKNVFTQNGATTNGGAISSGAGNLTISESEFSQNYAGAGGGAVSLAANNLSASKAEFVGNGSQGNGGAVLAAGADAFFDETEFLANKAGINSAGTYVAGGAGSDGGAIRVSAGTYDINRSLFALNGAADDGGAVDAAANGSAAGDGIGLSGFVDNEAGKANTLANQESIGGAVNLTTANQSIVDSEFLVNDAAQTNTNAAATSRGGAVAIDANTLTMTGSTLAGNTVSSSAAVTAPAVAAAGGAVYVAGNGTLASTNSTFTLNQAPVAAVAWSTGATSALTFQASTIADNRAPAGSSILVSGRTAAGAINVTNSVIAEGSGNGSACAAATGGTLVNGGGNVLTTTTDCGANAFVGTNGAPAAKVTAAQLDLKALADNGGPTDTMALGVGSVAASSANGAGLPATDQRGFARPGTFASSGAYQLTVRSLTVSKAGQGAGTVVSDPAGINCGPGCQSQTGQFAAGPPPTLVTLTATADSESAFQSWTGTCVSNPTPNSCVVNVDAVSSITANYATNLRTLTVSTVGDGNGTVTSSPAGINCGTTCEADFTLDSVVTLTASAASGSSFGGWGGACASAGTATTCNVTMSQARSATAEFTVTPQRTLTVNKSGAVGTVTSSPAGINCGTACEANFTDGQVVTLTAAPGVGSQFAGWGGACASAGTATTCNVTMNDDRTVSAEFVPFGEPVTLTVFKSGNGEGKVTSSPAGIDCGTTCEAGFTLDSTVTLTAEALGQSQFTGWSGACASAGSAPTCQVTMSAARSVSAIFSQTARVQIVKLKQGTIRVPSNRVISVGRVNCVTGTCNITQATARVKARGKIYRANTRVASGSFFAGESRTVKVVVPQAAYNRLRAKKSGSVTLVLRADSTVPGDFTEVARNISNGLRR